MEKKLLDWLEKEIKKRRKEKYKANTSPFQMYARGKEDELVVVRDKIKKLAREELKESKDNLSLDSIIIAKVVNRFLIKNKNKRVMESDMADVIYDCLEKRQKELESIRRVDYEKEKILGEENG